MSSMVQRSIQIMIVLLVLIVNTPALYSAASPDAPHDENAEEGSIGCLSCHDMLAYDQPNLIPDEGHSEIDDDHTLYNDLCWGCHNGIDAILVETHSSLQTSKRYGDWTIQCWVCHNQHSQAQVRIYGNDAYITTGTVTGLSSTTISQSGSAWSDNEFADMVLVPDITNVSRNYYIDTNTDYSLTVRGTLDPDATSIGATYGIAYGKYIRTPINLDYITNPSGPKSGLKPVKLFNDNGANSFADGDGVYDGVCEICHTETNHFRNTGEVNVTPSGYDHTPTVGTDCIDCHSHENGFAHGGGAGTGCDECHGHDPGYGGVTGGAGTFRSHSTHTENDTDDQKGPTLACSACHNTSQFPEFSDGQTTLAATTVCDDCHSEGGTYKGLSDATVGAKTNWRDSIYDHTGGNPHTIQSGKEKWCATCHDEVPSQVGGIDAPNIVGDEDGSFGYGTGWGYYKTGHGLGASQSYPASGAPGANQECSGCHDLSTVHVDDTHRTYYAAGDNYQAGYRLKTGMDIPRTDDGHPASDFALCFSCHDSGPFLTQTDYTTQFRNVTPDPDVNAHYLHLQAPPTGPWSGGGWWDSDWDGAAGDSKISCPACHNVHGSPSPRMFRHGELISSPGTTDKVPSLDFDYLPGSSTTLLASTGGATSPSNPGGGSIANSGICQMCHSNTVAYARTATDMYPPEITGVYGEVGSATLIVTFYKGVYTTTGASGNLVPGDFSYTDADDSRSIIGVTHTAGDNYATLTLSANLDDTDDIGTDTLAAATAGSIYDSSDIPMDTDPVTVEGDSIRPVIMNLSPADEAIDITAASDITFTLQDQDSGVDWSTFNITLTGTGYNEVYTDSDTGIVTATGSFANYEVTVNPAVDFPFSTVITATVDVFDMAGNQLLPSSWSFTIEDGPLTPSGLGVLIDDSRTEVTPVGGAWADILDTNDGDTTHVYLLSRFDGGGPTIGQHPAGFRVEMDDPAALASISKVDAFFTFRYTTPGGGPPGTSDKITIMLDTGGASEIIQETLYAGSGGVPSYTTISMSSTTDPDGGAWDLADIQNLRAGFQLETREDVGWLSTEAWVTEIYVKIYP